MEGPKSTCSYYDIYGRTKNKYKDIVNANKQVCLTFWSTQVQLEAPWAHCKALKNFSRETNSICCLQQLYG